MKSLLLALFTAASFAVDSFGQTVISSVPYHITSPGTYVLGANLTLSSVTGGAIVIRTNHVTLDLAGHYLFNPNPPSSSPLSWGVYVENGAMSLFRTALSLISSTECFSLIRPHSIRATLFRT